MISLPNAAYTRTAVSLGWDPKDVSIPAQQYSASIKSDKDATCITIIPDPRGRGRPRIEADRHYMVWELKWLEIPAGVARFGCSPCKIQKVGEGFQFIVAAVDMRPVRDSREPARKDAAPAAASEPEFDWNELMHAISVIDRASRVLGDSFAIDFKSGQINFLYGRVKIGG